METEATRERILDAAERLFYGQGVQAVGMDAVRSASGVTLRRLYQLFPSKGALVEAYLLRRDARWRHDLAAYVDTVDAPPGDRVLAVFDWLHRWFGEPGFRGCAFINSFGELGATSPEVAGAARRHKEAFRQYVDALVAEAGAGGGTGAQVTLLAEGAITTAAITGTPEPARQAREAARLLLRAAPAVAASG
ncbi:TetR/AcrR family transcriptional regulator [Streptomyces sp. SP18CS02]|uniref:TetR/AcrR family transcriptional regulator n=1 Tax=Streptomyces sp. SP18CS02 TaxID=3002531 RepID=UPI002E75FDCC|nr:TetR/AcrR family transcriptional regulator [Streptomyces sp. SP18CS02]MEE1757417.1 TetR/AcrR family transcriptional regulator [Streptomyces sp. SP18CS02]